MAASKNRLKAAREIQPRSEASLYEKFRSAGIEPVKVFHRLDGRLTLAWYVDDDDDRFVEVTDSVKRGGGYLLVLRDGDRAEASVWHSEMILVTLVRDKLSAMAARRKS